MKILLLLLPILPTTGQLYTNVPKRDFTVLDNAMIPDEAKVPLRGLREKLLNMLQDKYQQVIGRNEQFDKVYEWYVVLL